MTPLAESIRDVLERSGPSSATQIARELRLLRGKVRPDRIEICLRDHADLFRPLGDGRWDLAEKVPDAGETEPAVDLTDNSVETDPLVAGAVLDDFCTIDVETTGTDPERCELVQIAVVRVRGGIPVAALNWYLRSRSPVPESMRVRLGWPDRDQAELVELAHVSEGVAQFVGHDALVAWNASFDRDMLSANGLALDRCHWIDALAVDVLIDPRGTHALSSRCQPVESAVVDDLDDLQISGHAPDGAKAHDALFDALATARLHAENVRILRQGIGEPVASLLPELGAGSSVRRPAAFRKAGTRRPSTSPEETLRAVVAAEGKEQRPAQRDVAVRAHEALEGAPTLVEAPTGTGKTLAYIAAALAHVARNRRVALVTAYKNLQDQLLDEVDAAVSALDLDVRYAVLKGADNYLCRTRLEAVSARSGDAKAAVRYVLAAMASLCDVAPTATREDLTWWLTERFPVTRHILDECASGCSHPDCGRQLAVREANDADLVVLNQVIWLTPPSGFSRPSRAVIDEGHELETMATLAFSEEVSRGLVHSLQERLVPHNRVGLLAVSSATRDETHTIKQLLRRAVSAADGLYDGLFKYARALSRDVDGERGGKVRFRRAPRHLHPAAWTNAADSLRDLSDSLARLAQTLTSLANRPQRDAIVREDLEAMAERAGNLVQTLAKLTSAPNPHFVHFATLSGQVKRDWTLTAAPVDVGRLLQDTWEEHDGFLLISATLQSGPSDFSYVVARLGLDSHLGAAPMVAPTDLPFDENVLFGIARWLDAIPVPRFMQEFQAQTADEIVELARFGDGRLLGLFTATVRVADALDATVDPLAAAGIPVLAQGERSRQLLIQEFRERPESVLLATRSFWQGVDVPGEALSFVVIEKLPFPHLRDPVVEARLERIRRDNGDEFEDYILPQAVIGLKQGFGRLIRGRDDRGVVLLLDRRFHVKGYQGRVLDTLPGYRRIADREDSRRAFYTAIDQTFPGLISVQGRKRLDDMPERTSITTELPDVPVGGDREERRPAALQALSLLFGHDSFRTYEQEELFWHIHDGDDVIGLMPTGSGKSLPFQLAALLAPGTTLVVSPLIALMRDQVEGLLDKGIRAAAALVGGTSADERDEILRRVGTGEIRLLYISPERLRDPVFLHRLHDMTIGRVVVDEAHCVSMWGPSFRPEFLALRDALDRAGHTSVPIAALTATATPEIEHDIRQSLRIPAAHRIWSGFGRPNLLFSVLGPHAPRSGSRCRNDKDRRRLLLRILISAERRGEAAIIYAPTIRLAEELCAQARSVGVLARVYHGRMERWERSEVEETFRTGEIDVVFATKAFGMGIDRPDVRFVIHYGYPSDVESYYQEAGRAGRDDQPAWCLLLTLERDRGIQEWFIGRTADLDGALAQAADRVRSLGAGTHLLDLAELEATLGLDETLGSVVLHHLETTGILARGPDQTVEANVLLLDENPTSDAVLDRVLRACGAEPFVQHRVDLRELAQDWNLDTRDLEQRFIAASKSGALVFRPFRRLAAVEVGDGAHFVGADTAGVVAKQRKKLDDMEDYALRTEGCRQVFIRTYLGEESPSPCGVCDLCDPTFPQPWMEITLDSVPEADRLVDLDQVVLEAIDWNAREADRGRSPYGRNALTYVIVGNDYKLTGGLGGRERQRRLTRAQASPYWSAASLVTSADDKVAATIDMLLERGLVVEVEHHTDVTGTYKYLRPSERGRRVLEGEEGM